MRLKLTLVSITLTLLGVAAARGLAANDGLEGLDPGFHKKLQLPGYSKRPFDVLIPSGLTEPAPVLLVLHGGGADADKAIRTTCPNGKRDHPDCINQHAENNRYIAVFPRGTSKRFANSMRTWNAGGGGNEWICVSGLGCEQGVDDIAYFNRLLDVIGASGIADMNRVYATGTSNGGAMGHRLACELSDRIAAIAAVAGANQLSAVQGCRPLRPVPVLQIHGTDDCAWPYAGGKPDCRGVKVEQKHLGVARSMRVWRDLNRCSEQVSETPLPERFDDGTTVTRFEWQDCAAPLVEYRIDGGGHTWPNGYQYLSKRRIGPVSRELNNDHIWTFLAQHTLDGNPVVGTVPRSGGEMGQSLGLATHRIPLYWLDKVAPQPPGDYARWLRHGGLKRYYEVHVPPGYQREQPAPVIVALHGGGGNPAGLRWQANLEADADREGFVVIYPAGTHALFKDRALIWNVGPKRKQRKLQNVDDVAFLEAVLDDAAQFFSLDSERTYATGISNGSHMAYRFAAESDRVAAVAGVAGQERLGKYYPEPNRAVSVIHFHGSQDNWNPVDGALTTSASGFEARTLPPLDEHIADWRQVNQCVDDPGEPDPDAVHQQTACTDGANGSEVVLWLLTDGGHTWPGGRVSKLEAEGRLGGIQIGPGSVGPVSTLNANALMMTFFKRHTLDRPSPAHTAYEPAKPGAFRATQFESDLIDLERNERLIDTRITAPTGDGPFPLVIMSHGLGGRSNSHQSIVDHLVSHGYLVFAPNHPASDTKRVFEGRMDYATGPKPGLDPAAVLGRAPDVSFLIDQAEHWNQDPRHALYSKIDLDKIAIAGHSFGAFTVQSACGARPLLDHLDPAVEPGHGLAPSLYDPRIDVGIAYSPQGPGSGFFGEDSYASIACPILAFSGSKDKQGNGIGRTLPPRNRFRAFELMPAGDKYYVWIENAGHMGWVDYASNPPATRALVRAMTPENDDVVHLSRAMSVVFLDAYLRNDAKARSMLTEDYAGSLTGQVARRIRWSEK